VTVYLDTSSLVKLYVTEVGTDVVHQLAAGAEIVATSVVAYEKQAQSEREKWQKIRSKTGGLIHGE